MCVSSRCPSGPFRVSGRVEGDTGDQPLEGGTKQFFWLLGEAALPSQPCGLAV